MAIVIDYLHAHNHRDGSVSGQTNTSFNYQRSSSSHWHGAECNITGLTPGKEYKAKFRCSGTNESLLLALAGTTITTYTFDTTRSQEVGYFTSTELETTFVPTGTSVTALIIQHGGTPYYSFTFSNWEVKSKYELKDNLLDIQTELNEDLELVYDIIGTRPIVLPYIPLEYISTTGTQWIDSGVVCKSSLTSKVKFSTTKHSGGAYFGNNTERESDNFRMFTAGTGTWYLDFGSGEGYNRISGGSASINTVYEVEFGNRYIKNLVTDNNIISSSAVSSFSKGWNFLLSRYSESITIYYCKIYDNDVLIRDFIPAKRKSDNAIGMYDKETETFFTNAGTGEFIAGPEVI